MATTRICSDLKLQRMARLRREDRTGNAAVICEGQAELFFLC